MSGFATHVSGGANESSWPWQYDCQHLWKLTYASSTSKVSCFRQCPSVMS